MTGRTHALIGVSSLWLLTLVPPEYLTVNYGVLAACAALGALLPDLDASESTIKHLSLGAIKPFALPSLVLHPLLGHRRLLHSLLGLSLMAVLTLPVLLSWDWQAWVALVLGYASHLAADACTKWGVLWLYPRPQRYHLLPVGWRITTGSQAEEMLLPFLAASALLLFLTHLTP